MNEYKNLVKEVLTNGQFKENRTGVDTISKFGYSYSVDLQEGFPLLTTKEMDGYRWKSLIHEILWYFSGEEHIRNLREETSIWDEWADEKGNLDTAYGRFWRRYPVPREDNQLDGEAWVNEEQFDQIQYILDTLENNPNSRRMVLNSWHPGNATTSTLPPCHFSAVFNVQNINGRQALNCHLTQRSADIALGVPFNIAAYSILTKIFAQRAEMEVGEFHHTLVDAHIYCGKGQRSDYYRGNINEFQYEVNKRLGAAYSMYADRIEDDTPDDPNNLDHIPGLLRQISRRTMEKPKLHIQNKPIEDLKFDDFTLKGYNSHDGISFGVAE